MEKLKEYRARLYEEINDNAYDFYDTVSIGDNTCISDAITEFADSNTSIYYNDQRNYYNEHVDSCNNALLEFGYDLNDLLKECGDLDGVICKEAGAIGEFRDIENDIYDDLENVLRMLVLDHVIENNLDVDEDKVIEFIDNINTNYNRFSDLEDKFNTEFNLD